MKLKNENQFKKRRIAVIIILLLIITAIGSFSYNKYKSNKDNDHKDQKTKVQEANLKAKQEAEEKLKQEKLNQEKIQQAIAGKTISKPIPILMYHSIEYEKNNGLRIPKDKFRQQMQYLKEAGFTPLTLDQLYSAIVFDEALPDKPIVITLDDGYVDNYTNAYPVLKEFGFKATIFMITSSTTDNRCLNEAQLKELDKNGIDIESHTVTHKNLKEGSSDENKKELVDSKSRLEAILGKEVKYIAYPFGKYNEDTLKLAQEEGYKLAVTTDDGVENGSSGIYKLKRIYVSNEYDLEQYKKLVNRQK